MPWAFVFISYHIAIRTEQSYHLVGENILEVTMMINHHAKS